MNGSGSPLLCSPESLRPGFPLLLTPWRLSLFWIPVTPRLLKPRAIFSPNLDLQAAGRTLSSRGHTFSTWQDSRKLHHMDCSSSSQSQGFSPETLLPTLHSSPYIPSASWQTLNSDLQSWFLQDTPDLYIHLSTCYLHLTDISNSVHPEPSSWSSHLFKPTWPAALLTSIHGNFISSVSKSKTPWGQPWFCFLKSHMQHICTSFSTTSFI